MINCVGNFGGNAVPTRYIPQDLDRWLMSRNGQRQRLALGVVPMDIMIMDEPGSGLDGGNTRTVSHVIRQLSETGITVLMIFHDAECVLHGCNHAIPIEEGRVGDDLASIG